MMNTLRYLFIFSLAVGCSHRGDKERKPNVIIILADDLGYGDPHCYNQESKVPTPNIDALAAEGVMFMDAHTTSSVCTPTRYGLITGEYSWRGPLKSGVTWSYDSLIIDTNKSTIASLMRDNGYQTSVIGKWHLGLGWQKENDTVVFDKPLTKSPNDIGFDYFYGIAASLDIPPYVYIENNTVVSMPMDSTAGTSPVYKDDFWRLGPVSPDFDHHEALKHLTTKAEEVIRKNANGEKPFFLYFALTAPHLPWIPHEEFKGKSNAGNYGDLAAEVDDVVGRVTRLVKSMGIEENTVIIFTSDNGSQFSSEEMARYQHQANGDWRGRKGDIYEGGNRVPFIVKWPGHSAPGTISNQLLSTTDLYHTLADLVEANVDDMESKDSYSFLPAIAEAHKTAALRARMVYHSAKGMFALRDGNWVMIEGKGSGGFLEVPDTTKMIEPYQLFDLATDPTQATDVYTTHRAKTDSLVQTLHSIVAKK